MPFDPMNPPVGTHHGRRFFLNETSVEAVETMLRAAHIPTKLRLGYLHSCLFRSSTLPGQEPIGPHFIDWNECIRCRHGMPQQLPTVACEECGCKAEPGPFGLPPATADVVLTFIKIMDAFVAAKDALDWSIPASEAEKGLVGEQQPNTSMIGELLAEFEHSWKTIIMRVPGGCGPHGTPGPSPDWWTTSVREKAQIANRSWLHGFKGTGARGARPLAPDLDKNDDVFNSTGWLLQYYRLPEIQSLLAQTPVGAEMQLYFDEKGILRALPVGATPPAGPFATPPPPPPAADGGDPAASGPSASGATGDGAFAAGQQVLVGGLASRAELNGLIGEIIEAECDGRYGVKVGGKSVRIKPANLARTAASPQEGKIVNGHVLVCGEWFSMERFMQFSMHGGDAAGKAFAALDKPTQADVLAGRIPSPSIPSVADRMLSEL